ncbi:MAG: TonB-dependent receptor [Crocinitomicaceae bacterium]|nr:TonB-dependent receptor [Crocinitomicaceae bacterium]
MISVAQKGEVKGTVTDAKTGEAMIGAVVSTSPVMGTTTSFDGTYSLEIPAGNAVITFKMTGYDEVKKEVAVVAGQVFVLNVAMNESARELGIVVVSAGKYEQNLGEVTVSMEVIKPKLIQEKNITSIDEALQQTPGVSIVDNEPQIRSGSGYSFGAGSRVQVLMDDLPMISGDAGKPTWSFLPIENVSQVEIIKGASSVLYGSSALSGVINMRTAYPTDKPSTRLAVYHGIYSDPRTDSAKYWSGNAMRSGLNFLHTRKINNNIDFVIGANVLGDDGYLGPIKDSTQATDGNKYNPFTADRYKSEARARVNMNLRYRSKKISGLSYGFNTNWSNSNSLATLIWENTSTGLYSAYKGSATRTKQLLSTIDPFITYYNKKGGRQSLRTRWQSLDNNNDNNQGNFSDVYYGEYQFQQHWDSLRVKDFTTTFGIVGIHTLAKGELYTGGNADGNNSASNFAGYLQVDKKYFDKLNLSGGVRYEYFNINEESQSKPVFRAGANYQLEKATYLRASFGQGFRFPSIAEKFVVTSLGAITIFPNPDLKAESSYNAELGLKQGFRINKFLGFLDLAVFQQEYNKFIEFTFGQWDPNPSLNNQFGIGFKSLNTGKARVQGFEASLMGEGKIGAIQLQALAGYTYTKPVSLTPNEVYAKSPASPDNFFFLSQYANTSYKSTSSDPANDILKYRIQHLVRADLSASWRAYSLGLSFRSQSHIQNIDAAFQVLEKTFPTMFNPGINNWRKTHSKGDYIFDLRAGWEVNEHHGIAVVVKNLLNREYAIRPLAIEEPRLTSIQYTLKF